jgi:hypothetical protein
MYNTSRCPEIENRFPGLIAAIINAHKVQLEARPGERKKEVAEAWRRRVEQSGRFPSEVLTVCLETRGPDYRTPRSGLLSWLP